MYLFFLSVKIINPFSEYLTAGYSIFALLVVDFIIMYSEVITGVQLGGNEFANGKARHGCWLEMDVDEDVDGDVDKDVGMWMGMMMRMTRTMSMRMTTESVIRGGMVS